MAIELVSLIYLLTECCSRDYKVATLGKIVWKAVAVYVS